MINVMTLEADLRDKLRFCMSQRRNGPALDLFDIARSSGVQLQYVRGFLNGDSIPAFAERRLIEWLED